jgi:hypothetical protein
MTNSSSICGLLKRQKQYILLILFVLKERKRVGREMDWRRKGILSQSISVSLAGELLLKHDYSFVDILFICWEGLWIYTCLLEGR